MGALYWFWISYKPDERWSPSSKNVGRVKSCASDLSTFHGELKSLEFIKNVAHSTEHFVVVVVVVVVVDVKIPAFKIASDNYDLLSKLCHISSRAISNIPIPALKFMLHHSE